MPGVNLEHVILRELNGGDERFDLLVRAVSERLLPAHGPRSWWRDRLHLLGSAVGTALRFGLESGAPLEHATVVFDPGNSVPRMREVRTFFLDHHFGQQASFLGSGVRRRPNRVTGASWRYYFMGIGWALLALLDWSERRYTWVGSLLVDIQVYARNLPDIEKVYVFGLYHRRAYLVGTWLAKVARCDVVFVYQNIPLARNCSCLHVRVPVVLTSRVNLAEAAYFEQLGTFLPLSVTYAGQEFAIDTHALVAHPPRYDIGFYSSGEWARREGLYQFDDVEQVRRKEFEGNAYDRESRALLAALAAYAHSTGHTLRIYPHPMERRLITDHGIEPPYASLADGNLVSIELAGGDSRASMYECAVAVSLQSSFIWERLDLGQRDSFIYSFGDSERNVFLQEALGEYAENVFSSAEELIGKVDAALCARGVIRPLARGESPSGASARGLGDEADHVE